MRSIDKISATTIVICIGILADIGGASSFFASPLGSWVRANGVTVFWCAIALSALLLTFISALQRNINNKQVEIGDLEQSHRALVDQLRSESRRHTERLQGQLEERDARVQSLAEEIERLNRILNPSLRDRRLFEEILDDLPNQQGVIAYFRDAFDAKQWRDRNVISLYGFYDSHRESIFDNEEMAAALEELVDAASAMLDWLAAEGALIDSEKKIYRVASPGERDGGYEAFSEARRKGFELADKLLEVRRGFELKGRELGL